MPSPHPEEWNRWKSIISDIYIRQNHPLGGLMKQMKDEHGFSAT
jgi:hypothetical protein